jgi:hypothetical protein
MFLKSPLSLAPASGFVAFDGGGAVDVDAHRFQVKARVVVARPPVSAPEDRAGIAEAMRQSATWQPASAARARLVEGTVIIAICAYFVFGFAGLVHWI